MELPLGAPRDEKSDADASSSQGFTSLARYELHRAELVELALQVDAGAANGRSDADAFGVHAFPSLARIHGSFVTDVLFGEAIQWLGAERAVTLPTLQELLGSSSNRDSAMAFIHAVERSVFDLQASLRAQENGGNGPGAAPNPAAAPLNGNSGESNAPPVTGHTSPGGTAGGSERSQDAPLSGGAVPARSSEVTPPDLETATPNTPTTGTPVPVAPIAGSDETTIDTSDRDIGTVTPPSPEHPRTAPVVSTPGRIDPVGSTESPAPVSDGGSHTTLPEPSPSEGMQPAPSGTATLPPVVAPSPAPATQPLDTASPEIIPVTNAPRGIGLVTENATPSVSGPGRNFWNEHLAPVTGVDNYATTQNKALVISAGSGVLSNDSDPEGRPLTVTSFDAVSARGGSVSMNANGSFTYTPAQNFTGADSFTYKASDGSHQSAGTVDTFVYGPRPVQFESILNSLPENQWARLNTNQFRDVWVPEAQQPGIGTPGWVIIPWSAATWDANRNEYIFWGGGHAAYDGNEVYTWSAVTLQWERASLPSEVVARSNVWRETVDGPMNSPVASHNYDNIEFLLEADRMITFGGAAAHTGGPFVDSNGRLTGPYLWDPSKADPNKVGGLTGSHVNPAQYPNVVGGEMWENRDSFKTPGQKPGMMIYGTSDYALINGVDTVFVNDYNKNLWKYTVPDVDDPSKDTWTLVGTIWNHYSGGGAGAYDSARNIYVRTAWNEFAYWNLNSSGPSNAVIFKPSDPSGQFAYSGNWGMEYDPVRDRFVLWQGDGSIWFLEPPQTPSSAGWTLQKAPPPSSAAPSLPTTHAWTGVNGKWDYIDRYDVFIGVNNGHTGDVWVYKPEAWSPDGWMF